MSKIRAKELFGPDYQGDDVEFEVEDGQVRIPRSMFPVLVAAIDALASKQKNEPFVLPDIKHD